MISHGEWVGGKFYTHTLTRTHAQTYQKYPNYHLYDYRKTFHKLTNLKGDIICFTKTVNSTYLFTCTGMCISDIGVLVLVAECKTLISIVYIKINAIYK